MTSTSADLGLSIFVHTTKPGCICWYTPHALDPLPTGAMPIERRRSATISVRMNLSDLGLLPVYGVVCTFTTARTTGGENIGIEMHV